MMYNVVLITLDAVRPDYLGCYSPDSPAKTPFLKELGTKSAVFTQAITLFGGTPISHASILTGTSPITNACTMIGQKYIQPLDYTKTESISEVLKNNGYETAAITSVYLLTEDLGYARGFDYFVCLDGSSNKTLNRNIAEQVTDRATDWIKERKGNWFLWLHYFDAHPPFFPPEPYESEYRDSPYAGEIAYLDSQLSRLFSNVDLNTTVVVITADHGTSHGEHGIYFHGNFFEENLRIPLLIAIPGCSPCRIDALVRSIDIVPTVLEGLQIKDKPKNLEGVNLLPLIVDPTLDFELIAYCGTALDDGTIYAAIRTDRYKLIIDNYSATAHQPVLPGSYIEQQFGKAGMWFGNLLRRIRNRRRLPLPYERRRHTKKFLYDLESDPAERLNLLGDLEPYVTGIGRPTPTRATFPGLPWDIYDDVARDLEAKLRSYLADGVPRTELPSSEKDEIMERLRVLGYLE